MMPVERDILLDTGPVIALLDQGDPYHGACVDLWQEIAERCITTDAVVTESTHLVGRAGAASLPLELLLAARVPAQEMSFETTAGNSYAGKVVSDDGTTVEIETAGGAKVKVPYDALTPKTQYRLKRAKTGEDGKSQLALAEWCLSKTLYEEARTHYRKALAADATMADEINAKVVVARKTAANELLARAKGLMATDPKQARRILSELVTELPLEDATTEAKKLLAEKE